MLVSMMMGLGILWAVGARASAQVDEAFFDRFIAPALKQHCWDCHSHEAGEASGGLVLDSLAGLKQGGSRGAVIDTAAPDQSLLLRAIGYQDSELQMPPDGPLPAELVERFRQWAVAGYPVSEPWKQSPQPTPGEAVSSETLAANHWAYQPPVDRVAAARRHLQQLGTVDLESQLRSGIDVLVLEKLIDNGLQFSAPASRSVLLRRLSYVLLGLPPEEVMGRIDGDSLAAMDWEALVDRMLASPRFGERWARHWMDVARYADNKGYVFQEDREYPEAYRYRDWLIDAFNQDLPFDAMVKYQLAADQVPDGQSHLAAQGFLTLGRRFLNNKFDITDDRLDVVTRGLMGMTLTCARCHDHKYDPITQADYYALAGVFFNSQEPGGEPFAHRLVDAEKMQPAFILLRGSPGARGPQVPRRFVRFLAPDAPDFPDEASGRRQLAEHIVAPDNPLTARVLANRVWMHLTGAPLVDTPSDFGLRCPPPVQLPLLDHLAIYLVENGWSIKRLVRYIVTSRTFAQASEKRPEAVAVDPENRLWWRMPRQRLDFEAFRDTLLSRSGLLDRSMGGPSVRIDSMPYAPRRTLYAYIDRQNLPSLFRTFDMAGPDTHAPQRPRTSVPQQGLYMLNSPMVLDLAAKLGQRFRTMAEQQDTVIAIEGLFQQVLGRRPEGEELVWLIQFIQSDASPEEQSPPRFWECGYGPFDPDHGTLESFTPLPAFVDGGWRGGSSLPDPQLGWCLLTATGGHVGNDLQHAVVRRWHAPRAGRINIGGRLAHRRPEGDGVRGSILVDGKRVGEWLVHNDSVATLIPTATVKKGSTIDFVTDCRGSVSHDSFDWKVVVRYGDGEREEYDSQQQFPEPVAPPLDAWGQLAQVLLCTNELMFID